MLSGRLNEVQSRMNWVRMCGATLYARIPDVGCTFATVFISSGNNLDLIEEVDWHVVRTCSIEFGVVQHREHA